MLWRLVWYSDAGSERMRWLMIVLLVSVAGLLAVAIGAARHILLQRARQRIRAREAADALESGE